MQFLWNFLKDEEGLELVEYAVMLALIVVAIIVVIGTLSDEIEESFSRVTEELANANNEN